MVHYAKNAAAALDRTFQALADPARRAIVAKLAEGTSVQLSALAEPFGMSVTAVMKHVSVLERAGLVTREKVGRSVALALVKEPLGEAMAWLEHYARFWNARLDALEHYLEDETCQETQPQAKLPAKPSRASRSSAATRPSPRASSPPGRGRKR